MKGIIRISKKCGITYIPVNLVKEGYHGPVETLANAATVTLLKPDAPLKEVKRSLQIVIQDIQLRIDREKREGNNET